MFEKLGHIKSITLLTIRLQLLLILEKQPLPTEQSTHFLRGSKFKSSDMFNFSIKIIFMFVNPTSIFVKEIA